MQRHKGWWCEVKDELATHSMTTEVWISTRGWISEAIYIALQEALEEDNKNNTPSFGREDLEEIHRSGTQAGLLGIYNFPGSVYATDGSNDRGFMGAGSFKFDEYRGGCCQLGRGEELGVDGSVWFMGEGNKVLGPTNWTTTRLIDPDYFLGEKIVMVSVETNDDRAWVPGEVFYAVGEKGGLFMWGRWEVHGRPTILRPQKMDTIKYSPHKVVMVKSSASATHVMLNTGYVCEIGNNSSLGATLDMGDARMHNNALEYPCRVRQRTISIGDRFMVSVDVDGNLYPWAAQPPGLWDWGRWTERHCPWH